MDLKPFKCSDCNCLPESDVFICNAKHIYCVDCAKKVKNKCKCSFDLKLSCNPLEVALLNVTADCLYKSEGCTWKFTAKDLQSHLDECKFRPYDCVGNKLNAWKCEWKGKKHEVVDHFKTKHSPLHKIYSHSEEDNIFIKTTTTTTKPNAAVAFTVINLIDAFNKTFIFYFERNPNSGTINIIIFLLGRKQAAKKYLYELEIIHPTDKQIRIKFTQPCYSDTENIKDVVEAGKCVSLSQKVVEHYIHNDRIQFRFRMNRRELDVPNNNHNKSLSQTDLRRAGNIQTKNMGNKNYDPSKTNKGRNQQNFGNRIGATFKGSENAIKFRNQKK